MKLEDAINASQIWAARGYDQTGECAASVAYYGERLVWLKGFGGNWAKGWKPVDEAEESDRAALEALDFRPSGPKPAEQIEQEVLDALKEIGENEDDFEPMGETYG